jgi:hypothetical protein
MNLFHNYFRTLRLLLPRDQRDDIIRELSEEIHSQVADKEAVLGRPLNPSEQKAILQQLGHPIAVASRYRPQRYLVGPMVFPYYWLLIKVVVALVVVTQVMGTILLIARGGSVLPFSEIIEATISNGLKAVAWLTVLAVIADYWLRRSSVIERWTPRMPSPPFDRVARAWEQARAVVPESADRAIRSASVLSSREPTIAGLLIAVAVSIWWLLGLRNPTILFGSAAADLTWGAAMNRLYPVLLVAQVLTLSHHFLRLKQPRDAAPHRASGLIWLLTGIAFVYLVFSSDHQWLVWPDRFSKEIVWESPGGRAVSLPQFVNYTFSAIFGTVALAAVVRAISTLMGRVTGRRRSTVHA